MTTQNLQLSKGALRLIIPLVLAVALGLVVLGLVTAQGGATLVRVTTASDSGRASYEPSLSADGTIVAFRSDSDFLGQGIPDNQFEIWLKRVGYRAYLPLVLRQVQ